MIRMIPVLLRGIGQVVLQGNAVSGLLMLAAILADSWQAGLLALGGCLVGTLTACLLRCDEADIRQGLYGFNATLVGLAAAVFLRFSPAGLLVAALFAALSAVVTRLFFMQKRVPAFTAPFILCTWCMLALCAAFLPETLMVRAAAAPSAAPLDVIRAAGAGIGQVFKGFGGLIGGFQHLLLRFHLWYFQDGKGVAYMHIVAFLDAKFYNSAWQFAGYSVF